MLCWVCKALSCFNLEYCIRSKYVLINTQILNCTNISQTCQPKSGARADKKHLYQTPWKKENKKIKSLKFNKKASNYFNVIRQLSVINCIEGDVLFQMAGKMSITADTDSNDVLKYQYTLNYNPKMWIPVKLKNTNKCKLTMKKQDIWHFMIKFVLYSIKETPLV